MINHKFISFFAVQIYDISYIHLKAIRALKFKVGGLNAIERCYGKRSLS